MKKSANAYAPPGSVDTDVNGEVQQGSWRNENIASKLQSLPKNKQRCPKNAEEMRDLLCNYVNGPGAIPWQWRVLVP